jgi:hypothetical protein
MFLLSFFNFLFLLLFLCFVVVGCIHDIFVVCLHKLIRIKI